MIKFQEFMLTSKHFCLIRSDIPFRLICNPNGGDWLSGTDICNLPAGSFTFDFYKLLPEKYFKNNPAFKLGLAYDADLLVDGRKVDVSYSDLDYGTGVAGLAGSSESSLAEIVLIDTLISDNLSVIKTSIEDSLAPDLSNMAFDIGEMKTVISQRNYSNFTSGLRFTTGNTSFCFDDLGLRKIKPACWLEVFGWIILYSLDNSVDFRFNLIKVCVQIYNEHLLDFMCLARCEQDDKLYFLYFSYNNASSSNKKNLIYVDNLSDNVSINYARFEAPHSIPSLGHACFMLV